MQWRYVGAAIGGVWGGSGPEGWRRFWRGGQGRGFNQMLTIINEMWHSNLSTEAEVIIRGRRTYISLFMGC